MPIAITEEQRALASSIQDWARRGEPIALVREMETGADPAAAVEALAAIGLFAMALPEELGGAGAGIVDVAAGVEQAAAELAPGAVFGTVLGGLLLATAPGSAVAKESAPGIAEGTVRVAVDAWGGPVSARRTADGGLVLDGDSGPVLDAAERTHLLLSANDGERTDWVLLAPGTAGLSVAAEGPVDFSRDVATVRLRGVDVPATAVIPGLTAEVVGDLAATVAVAEAAGIAAWCVRTASDYAKVREQFGKPIGSFQAVKHLCAEMLCRSELAGALAWDAARAADEAPAQHALAAAAAAAGALDAAVANAKDCIQVLGGIGFTWEHDAHLYLRRALATRALAGGSARWRRRATELALGGDRRRLDADLLGDSAELDRLRERATTEARAIAALPDTERRARLADSGYLAPHWPAPYGLDATPAEQLVIDGELAAAGVDRPDLVIGGWAIPTIVRHGTPEQRERFASATMRGEVVWCQLFSEPGAGSDLASLRTKANRADGGWRISGQKVWTSLAREADWAICLARTNPDAPKHKGITYFLVDMRSAGVSTRPLREITGESVFNEVFLDEVFVPDEMVVGEVDAGWGPARSTLANERVALSGGTSIGADVEALLELATARGLAADPAVTERIGALISDGAAGALLGVRATLRTLAGAGPGAESSVRKLAGVRQRQAVGEFALELHGRQAAVVTESTVDALQEFLVSRCLSIAGGTTQVLLNLTAERLLGLPRG